MLLSQFFRCCPGLFPCLAKLQTLLSAIVSYSNQLLAFLLPKSSVVEPAQLGYCLTAMSPCTVHKPDKSEGTPSLINWCAVHGSGIEG
jgi:hypothetical protein